MTDAERTAIPDGTVAIRVPVAPTSTGYRIAKRGLDLVASGFGLVVTSPLLLGIAAAVRLESPGPILFQQGRVGVGGRPFTVFKFRSMHAEADEAAHREYVRRLLVRREGAGTDVAGAEVGGLRPPGSRSLRTPGSPAWGGSCGARISTSCPSC